MRELCANEVNLSHEINANKLLSVENNIILQGLQNESGKVFSLLFDLDFFVALVCS